MIAHDLSSITAALRSLAAQWVTPGPFYCYQCGLTDLTEAALHAHFPLYHSIGERAVGQAPEVELQCPICHLEYQEIQRRDHSFAWHLHNR
jgi:hypothetical protein